jgi:hypothetical protein
MDDRNGNELENALDRAAQDGKIDCAAAERVAAALELPLPAVGETLDARELKIVKCQLGLFGFGTTRHSGAVIMPAPEVSAELEGAIRAALVGGRMPCAAAWKIADRLGLGRIEVAEACEGLAIKIKPCQLGAF